MNQFSEIAKNFSTHFELPHLVDQNLQSMGIMIPTEMQKAAVLGLQEHQELAMIAPTGSGKTICYLLPMLHMFLKDSTSRALVLAPTREVAEQIAKMAEKVFAGLGLSVASIVGGVAEKPQASQLRKNPRLIVATPGRIQDHLKNNKLLLQNVRLLVLDEADTLMAQNFSPQLKFVRATMRGEIRVVYVSASKIKVPENVFFLDLYQVAVQKRTIEKVYFVDSTKKRELLLSLVQEAPGRVLIFTYDQYVCEDIREHLKSNGQLVDAIHGKMQAGQRQAIMENFRAGKYRILVTTDLLSRGLDIADIDLVINFDLPKDEEHLLHRMGRTARAGRSGKIFTLVSSQDQDKFDAQLKHFEKAERIEF